MEWLVKLLHFLFGSFELDPTRPLEAPKMPQDATSIPNAPQAPTSPNPAPMNTVPATIPESELLPWTYGKSFTHNNWKNVRIICDQEGLSHALKEELCATVWAESEFNTDAKCINYKTLPNGTRIIASVDNGIAQWNSYWHGKEITPTQAIKDPEFAIRLMCRYFKRGLADQWVAHLKGRYTQYLGRTL